MLPGHLGDLLRQLGSEKALGHEKAQKAQREQGYALAETFTGWVTTVATPSSQSVAFVPFCGGQMPDLG